MTKLIVVLAIVLAAWVGWEVFVYYDRLSHEETVAKREAAAAVITSGDQLSGMPYQLENAFRTAQSQGITGLRRFLKDFGKQVQEPRKTWIDLDYCMLLARESPPEARKLFAEIKARNTPASPCWPRIKSLEKTYE